MEYDMHLELYIRYGLNWWGIWTDRNRSGLTKSQRPFEFETKKKHKNCKKEGKNMRLPEIGITVYRINYRLFEAFKFQLCIHTFLNQNCMTQRSSNQIETKKKKQSSNIEWKLDSNHFMPHIIICSFFVLLYLPYTTHTHTRKKSAH